MTNENRKRSRDRSFWILFSAGWAVYSGIMVVTALFEGREILPHLATVLPPAAFSVVIAYRPTPISEARMAHLEDGRGPLRCRRRLCGVVGPGNCRIGHRHRRVRLGH